MAHGIALLAKRQIHSYFVTPFFYVLASLFTLLCGFFFFTLLQQFSTSVRRSAYLQNLSPSLNEFVVQPFYQTVLFLLVCVIPLLVMSAFPRERQLGTYEILLTSPLGAGKMVLGVFFGLFGVLFFVLLGAFIFPLTLVGFADPEVPPLLVGFGGLVLFSASLLALSVGISAFARSQAVAAFVSFAILLFLFVLEGAAEKMMGGFGRVLSYLSPSSHMQNLLSGVVVSGDVIYFVTLALFGLFLAQRVLEAERWR